MDKRAADIYNRMDTFRALYYAAHLPANATGLDRVRVNCGCNMTTQMRALAAQLGALQREGVDIRRPKKGE